MTMTRKEAENDIKEMMGFVPDFYDAMPDAAFGALWSLQKGLELGETHLEAKTKELIGLAMASQIKCKYCIYFHTKAATAFGAKEEEIKEAIALGGMTNLFSNMVTGEQTDYDRFKADVDKAIEYMASHAPAPSYEQRPTH